ncbi:activator-dependent family glycosyltransferase [Streptomyces sp. SID5594]|nr:activator-dependent family glycosyltransferase [Streptomyces sp. SID5594]
MRIMFATWPATSHLYPAAPLAWALQSAGHEVVVASYPALADTVVAAGLTAVSLGAAADTAPKASLPDDELDVLAAALGPGPDEGHLWEFFRHRILPVLSFHYPGRAPDAEQRAMVDDLVSFARDWRPDLVLWDPAFLAAPVAARACGAAHARLMWGLDYFGWIRERCARLAARPGGNPVGDPLVRLAEPMHRRFGYDSDEEMFLGQWTVDLMPPGMRLPLDTRSVSLRAVPYQQTSVMPPWLRERPERPRVCLTLGVTGRERFINSGVPLSEVLDMMSGLDVEVVATLNADQLASVGQVPPNVRTLDYVPLNQLLPTCSAIVHHGGFGTFAAAAAQRLPQLITGALSAWDRGVAMATARYVESRGAGLAMAVEGFTPEVMRKHLLTLLHDPSLGEGATELYHDLLATPSPADIVPVLEQLTARARG